MVRAQAFATSLLVALAGSLGVSLPAMANDQMFPAETAAAGSIGWNNNYFVVNGKPTILSSGSIHYARVPKELWREHLIRAKRAGINTIQSYIFWNAQEPQEGVFDFGDNKDLDTWLSTIEEVGLYSVIRLGPYSCAEWLSGGIPQWLTAQSGMQVRNDYAPFVSAVDTEFEQLVPILLKHQIHKGGSLLFVQLENEHPSGAGTDDGGDPYLTHLYTEARSLGLEVPLFYSGLHHSGDPAGTTPFGDRTYPWYSTEFWSGWYTDWGELSPSALTTVARGAWKVIAFGGGGANYYMFHGGTNFGYSGDTGVTTYDYGAPVGEEGQFRQAYFAVREPALFAQTFESLMATSEDGSSLVSQVANGLQTYVRKTSSQGIAVFLDNQGPDSIETQVTLNNPSVTFPAGNTRITVASNEIRPVVVSAPWTANATFAYLATNVLGKLTLGTKTYYVLHGRAGEAGEVAVQYVNAPTTAPTAPWTWDESSKLARATFTYPSDGNTITEMPLDSGDGASATFLVINTDLSQLTWFTDQALFVGATYVDEDLSIEEPAAGGNVVIYSSSGKTNVSEPPVTLPTAPALGNWQWRDAAAEASPGYDDSTWFSSAQPQPFGANNFQNGYGWYRAKFMASSAGNVTVGLAGVQASAMAFANGTQVSMNNTSVSFPTVAGENTLAILAWHEGLDKMYNFTGAPGNGQYAGIWGPVNSGGANVSSWLFRGGLGQMDETSPMGLVNNWTTFLGGTWASSAGGEGPAFWETTFSSPLRAGVFATVGLQTGGLSSGSAWVNGHNIGRFSGNNNDTPLYVPECWLTPTSNALVIYDSSGNSPTGVKLQYFEARAVYPNSIGSSPDGGAGPDGGSSSAGSDAGPGLASDSGSSLGSSGSSGSSGAASVDSGSETPGTGPGSSGGCSCTTEESARFTSLGGLISLSLGFGSAVILRRRRRS